MPGSSVDEHLKYPDQLFSKLREAGMTLNFMTLNLHQCKFVGSSVHFLEYIVISQGITKDPEYVETIRNLPKPANSKEL